MGKLETTISGMAFQSTVEQMSLIGSIGKEILQEYKVTKVDLNKKYSSKLRGAIHDSVRKRFGKEALLLFGLTVVDGYSKINTQTGRNDLHKFFDKNSNKLDSPNMQIARKTRNDFLEACRAWLDANKKKVDSNILK